MIVYIDGLSGLGKSTLVNTLKENNPEWLNFKGAGAVNIGLGKVWQNYNFEMHRIIERLDQCNDYKKVILWDRGLTDCVYSTDEFYKSEMMRVIRSHHKVCGIHLTCWNEHGYSQLVERRNDTGFTYKEPSDISPRLLGYTKAFKGIRNHKVLLDKEPTGYIGEHTIKIIETFINEELTGYRLCG